MAQPSYLSTQIEGEILTVLNQLELHNKQTNKTTKQKQYNIVGTQWLKTDSLGSPSEGAGAWLR